VARKRPTASDVSPVPANLDAAHPVSGVPDRADGLSHAQARALLRCTPLTSADFGAERHPGARFGGPKRPELPSRLDDSVGAMKRRSHLGIGRLREEGNRVDE